jgi:RNA recognition motif-containing protein
MSEVNDFQVFVGNLENDTTDRMLYDHFRSITVGILNAKVVRDASGKSRGFGFIKYDSYESAVKAVASMNSSFTQTRELSGNCLVVKEVYKPSRSEIEQGIDLARSRTIFVGNLNVLLSEDELERSFSKFGQISSCRVVANRGFGFITFYENVSAIAALSEMQNVPLRGQRLYCTWGRQKDQPPEEYVDHETDGKRKIEKDDSDYCLVPSPAKKLKEEDSHVPQQSRKDLLNLAISECLPQRKQDLDSSELRGRNSTYIVKQMESIISELI